MLACEPVTGADLDPIVDLLAEELDAAGLRVDVRDGNRPGARSIIAEAGDPTGADGAGLTLNGHVDVVPPGRGWATDPWVPTVREDRLHGRGTCDMLGFVAVAVGVAADHVRDGRREPLAVVLTPDEERGSLGAEALAAGWPADRMLPRCCVVGEPTSLGVVRMHAGHAKLAIELRGRAAHSGTPHLGRSVMPVLSAVLAGLEAHRRDLESERPDIGSYFPAVPHPTLNVGRIDAGGAINVVAPRARIELGVRPLPGDDGGERLDRLEDIVRAAAEAVDPQIALEFERLGDNPPLLTEARAPSVRRLVAATGTDGERGVSFASDGGHLSRGLGLEPVLCGPGDMSVAHRPDEFVPLAELAAARSLLVELSREATPA